MQPLHQSLVGRTGIEPSLFSIKSRMHHLDANTPSSFYTSYVSSSLPFPTVQDGRIERLARGQWVTTTCDSLSLYTLETKKPAILFGERARSTTTRPLDYTHLRLIDRANGGIMAFARIAPEVRSEG
jgi:hypothetical protein